MTHEFELYDLKVEVIAPPGAKLWCNAQPGDWFELRGELLFLPPDQGFSIYSLAAVLPLLLTEVVAMGFYQGCVSGFGTRTQNLNDQLM